MGLGFRQWARITFEDPAEPGVYDTDAIEANILYPRIMSGDALNFAADKQVQVERSADAGNEPTSQFGPRTLYNGTLRTWLRPDQASFYLRWGCIPVNRTLPSATVDWFDGTRGHRFLNVKVEQAEISADNQTDGMMLSMQLLPSIRAPLASFPEPASTVYPTNRPYLFQDSKGLVSLNNGTLVGYKSLQVTFANTIARDFDEENYLAYTDYAGRDVTWMIVKQETNTTYWDAFEQQTALTNCQIKFAVTTSNWDADHSINFDFQDINYLSGLSSDRSFESRIYESLSGRAFKDGVTGTSVIVEVDPAP